MKTTAAVLRTLQDYYASLPSRPSAKEIARMTNMPNATVSRYLNGTTQQGDLERVRSLCIALDRHDLLEELPKVPNLNSFQDAMALILEVKKESRESNLEELNRVRSLHEQAEMRWEKIVESKDKSIELLTKRIEQLEKDKTGLVADKAEIMAEMKTVRRAKRKYEAGAIALFGFFVLYFIIFDLPYPDTGLTKWLVNVFK